MGRCTWTKISLFTVSALVSRTFVGTWLCEKSQNFMGEVAIELVERGHTHVYPIRIVYIGFHPVILSFETAHFPQQPHVDRLIFEAKVPGVSVFGCEWTRAPLQRRKVGQVTEGVRVGVGITVVEHAV